MSANLRHKLDQAGCHLRLDGATLYVRGPLTDELRAAIRQHKQALIAELQRRAAIDYQVEAALADDLLETQGWCAVKSSALGGEVVLWVRDSSVPVPDEWRDCVRYTAEELAVLADTRPRLTREGLQKTHEVKRVFDGAVVSSAEAAPWVRQNDGSIVSGTVASSAAAPTKPAVYPWD